MADITVSNRALQPSFHRGSPAGKARRRDPLKLIEKNFDRFDINGDGRIPWSELRRSIANPEIQGEHAAALATLYSMVSEKTDEAGRVRKFTTTPAFIEELRDDREFAREEGEPSSLDRYYERYLNKLEKASNELFPHHQPHALKLRQGFAPSCAFLAATVAQAQRNPQSICEAITTLDSGKISVKFPGLKNPILTSPTTDTETALFASAGKDGTWANQLEKAWGTLKGNALTAFEHSSWPTQSIRAWSNSRAVTLAVPKRFDDSTTPGHLPACLDQAAQQLALNHIVVTWTRRDPQLNGLISKHAHTMLGIDPKAGTVQVRQPWGHHEPSNAQGKPRDGKNDGIFHLSFQEYAKNFSGIAFQTSDPRP